MEMRDEKERIVELIICRRLSEHDAGDAAHGKEDDKTHKPKHWRRKTDAAAIHREEPVEYFDAGRDGDDHRHDAEKGIDRRARAHRKEMVEPYDEGEDDDSPDGIHHRGIPRQFFARKDGYYLRKDAKSWQNKDIYLGVSPCPYQIDVHHHVAAGRGRKKMHAKRAVERKERERHGENRKGKGDERHRAEHRPRKHWHFHQRHPLRSHRGDGRKKIDAGEEAAEPRNLQTPYPIINADCRRVLQFGKRRVRKPPSGRKIPEHEREIDQCCARDEKPERKRIEKWKCDVARADNERQGYVDKRKHKSHRHKKNHDGAVSGEYLLKMIRGENSLIRSDRKRLLRPHKGRVGKPADEHDAGNTQVHDAYLFRVERSEPFAPQPSPEPVIRDEAERDSSAGEHEYDAAERDRVGGNRRKGELAEEYVVPVHPVRSHRQKRILSGFLDIAYLVLI